VDWPNRRISGALAAVDCRETEAAAGQIAGPFLALPLSYRAQARATTSPYNARPFP